jgi:TnpA family transposase
VEFLSDEEASAYGAYRGLPSQSDLEKLFFLDDADRQLIAKRRGAHNRLGFALLLTTVRYLGVFLPDPLAVPDGVTGYLAGQLEISDPAAFSATPNVARRGSSTPTRSRPPAGCASSKRWRKTCGSG